jgi:hypothetical protein
MTIEFNRDTFKTIRLNCLECLAVVAREVAEYNATLGPKLWDLILDADVPTQQVGNFFADLDAMHQADRDQRFAGVAVEDLGHDLSVALGRAA